MSCEEKESYKREGRVKVIRRVHGCKGLRYYEFCKVFSRYYGYPKVM